MKSMMLVLILCAVGFTSAFAQDSVDVTFRYNLSGFPGGVSVPGQFNGWNNTAWPMTFRGGTLWTRDARLAVGGAPGPIVGAFQYKFYYNGVTTWPNDPLNHHVNVNDNDNSFIYVKDPAFYHVLPNQRQGVITTGIPTITAYIYPKVGASIDTSSIQIKIDATTYATLGSFYNTTTKQLSYPLQTPLANGSHTMIIKANSTVGGSYADTVTFVSQAGFVQISTQGGYQTLSPTRVVRGIVRDTTVSTVRIVRNNTDTTVASVSQGSYSATVNLVEGLNSFRAIADSGGTRVSSSPVTFTFLVNHSPTASVSYLDGGSTIQLQATTSTDPDPGQTQSLTYVWSEDPSNPSIIGGINGATSPTVTFSRPLTPGEYYFGLIATDVDGHRDTTRSFFTLKSSPPITPASLASVPQWVREGRLYEMFFKSHTPAGTINAAYPDLDRIAAMGYNIIWLMPVMKNRFPINNGGAPGYDITDFYTVAPEYGTNADLKTFITRAHQLGVNVILDVTPSHSSAGHPFALDARAFLRDSRYWNYYQHQFIPYTGVGLGQLSEAMTPDGFVYYGAFSDELLNWNYADLDARQYMLDMQKFWIQYAGVDGYRLDVYWGPHIRANSPNGGQNEYGRPMRQYLKHFRPDLYLLGEATGVGPGTEILYADNSSSPGGVESAYDWPLKDVTNSSTLWTQVPAGTVNQLDQRLRNGSSTAGMGYIPGSNSYFMRFLENHDEDRAIYLFSRAGVDPDSIARKRIMAYSSSLLLAVGLPMVYSGQEVGWGLGISNYDQRRRGVVNWNSAQAGKLMPHYQKLGQIKKQFPAFSTQQMVRVNTDFNGVYAYTRPYAGQNGVVVSNFENIPHTVTVALTSTGSPPSMEGVVNGVQYYASNLYSGTFSTITFASGTANLVVDLPAYGSAVFVIDAVQRTLVLPPLTDVREVGGKLPAEFSLAQNYPNPFNPSTKIGFKIMQAGFTTLKVYDILGREIETLVNADMQPGTYEVPFDGRGLSSGVYFYRLNSGSFSDMKKMVFTK